MRELVGSCKCCGKAIYCDHGFLNGMVMEDRTLLCFDCFNQEDDAESS
ncbi:hypothetical protein [Paenibacillus hexagrammi]|uniref:Uncharacterized protein n=1 Tax=Paenibacillus hexagrammi TaxID=2908839 RepID=A0ABY3SLD0_9BACL|nr:hypothetical protein [Paenibacillus sp. YPD9-1]UJF34519.1 hypothetical protein L0M14_04870 [Paenibacillus sp. YPD9-1]